MIVGVIKLSAATRHDAPRSTVRHTGRSHGVFTVVPAIVLWKHALEIAKYGPIALMGEWAALPDETHRLPRLDGQRRQGYDGDRASLVPIRCARPARERPRHERNDEGNRDTEATPARQLHDLRTTLS